MSTLTPQEADDYDRVWRYIADDIRSHQDILHRGLQNAKGKFVTITKWKQPEVHQALLKEAGAEWHSSAPNIGYDAHHPWHLELARGKQHSTLHNALQSFIAHARDGYLNHLGRFAQDDTTLDHIAIAEAFQHFEVEMQSATQIRLACCCFVVDTQTANVSELTMKMTASKGIGLNYAASFISMVHTFSIHENWRLQTVDEIMARIFGKKE